MGLMTSARITFLMFLKKFCSVLRWILFFCFGFIFKNFVCFEIYVIESKLSVLLFKLKKGRLNVLVGKNKRQISMDTSDSIVNLIFYCIKIS